MPPRLMLIMPGLRKSIRVKTIAYKGVRMPDGAHVN
jgi:hypothetical protein